MRLAMSSRRQNFGVLQLERIGNILEENQSKSHMLVIRGLHIATQLVCGLKKFRLNPKLHSRILRFRLFPASCHDDS